MSSDAAASAAPSESAPAPSRRLVSLDALRGFDMFWIVGAEAIVHAIGGLYGIDEEHPDVSTIPGRLVEQLTHAEWQGFRFYDLIFPLFVFIAGVSTVFSLTKSLERHGRGPTVMRVIRRGVLLYVIGVLYYGGIANGLEGVRLMGVLQRIALAYLAAGLLFCFLSWRGLLAACVVLLAGYWAAMTFIPVPGRAADADIYAEGQNLANYVDKEYLPFFKWDGDHDPEGLLSTFPAIATCLLGVFAGMLLHSDKFGGHQKAGLLVLIGVACLAGGWGWSYQFPIIKKLWTSSYVLWAGGWSFLLLALFYEVVEVLGWQAWCQPFVWIGRNPITIYLLHQITSFPELAEGVVGGEVGEALGGYHALANAIVVMVMTFAICWYLDKKRVYLRL